MQGALTLSSERHRVDGSWREAIEYCHRQGWTDGLPVVPPTEGLVADFLRDSGRDPDEIVGVIPERAAEITVEKAAINAAMAGCLPEYFPLVLAALEGVCDPAFMAHAALTAPPASASYSSPTARRWRRWA